MYKELLKPGISILCEDETQCRDIKENHIFFIVTEIWKVAL